LNRWTSSIRIDEIGWLPENGISWFRSQTPYAAWLLADRPLATVFSHLSACWSNAIRSVLSGSPL
jgi:hypothetical protein